MDLRRTLLIGMLCLVVPLQSVAVFAVPAAHCPMQMDHSGDGDAGALGDCCDPAPMDVPFERMCQACTFALLPESCTSVPVLRHGSPVFLEVPALPQPAPPTLWRPPAPS